MTRAAIPKPCAHHPTPLPYLAASFDADERIARGEAQTQCPDCGLWFWPDELRALHQPADG
ncbi:hypothetical protein [Humibacter sp.]|uniref:hypothetical protein n=1 Tax=Humibacter sp. TaxID=1940291 RepID=UPI003F816335